MASSKLQQQLIFGGGTTDGDKIAELDELDSKREFTPQGRKPSAYVEVLEKAARTVLEKEDWLLSADEVDALERFSKLNYNARYCLTRLALRKANRWHPISDLEDYTREVGLDGLHAALHDLCIHFPQHSSESEGDTIKADVKVEPMEMDKVIKTEEGHDIVDLTGSDSDQEDVKPQISGLHLKKEFFDTFWPQRAGPSQRPQPEDPIQAILTSDSSMINLDFFCEDESVMSIPEILGRLNKDKSIGLAKDMKCKIASNAKKEHIIVKLQEQASGQQVLNFGESAAKKGKGKSRQDGLRQTQLTSLFSRKNPAHPAQKSSQKERLKEMALKLLGQCIRVNIEFHRLIRRLHIIYFRETEHPTQLLLPALLSRFKKRNFTPYKAIRTTDVWVTRQDFLKYEKALELDSLVDDIWAEKGETVSKRASKTPSRRRESFATPNPPGPGSRFSTPLKTPASVTNRQSTTPAISGWDDDASTLGDWPGKESVVEKRKEERIKEHLEAWIYPTWQECVADEDRGVRPRRIGVERFDAGHVFTRMVHKAVQALGPLQEFELELGVLDELLNQRLWCRGKRSKWYTRRAIVLGHLLRAEKDPIKKKILQERLRDGLKIALLDSDTGTVHRPSLVKRLLSVEKTLKTPPDERLQCEGELRQAPNVVLQAVRVDVALHLDVHGRPILEKENTPELLKYITIAKKVGNVAEEPKKLVKRTGKSSWKGRNDQIVNVETRALEHYEDQGYKGLHCETSILTTLFGLLCWDIIFADVPGAFDTSFQYAPLDILQDSFYRAREDLINARMKELEDGKGREILQKHDEAYRDKALVCAGVHWDLLSRDDLLEVVDCLKGQSLASICILFCEDYAGRSSGGPDLFVWNAKEQKCKFVEVKGPNDKPQENQKLWFDSLLRAEVDIEICLVQDIKNPPKKHVKRKSKTPASAHKTANGNVLDSEEEDYDQLDRDHEEAQGQALQQVNMPIAHASNKRRRLDLGISEVDGRALETMGGCLNVDSPTPSVNRGEVVVTPSKAQRV